VPSSGATTTSANLRSSASVECELACNASLDASLVVDDVLLLLLLLLPFVDISAKCLKSSSAAAANAVVDQKNAVSVKHETHFKQSPC
jgi:hypothetical protein